MAKRPEHADDAHGRVCGLLHQARVRGGWSDEDVADRILQELGLDHDGTPVGGAQRAASGPPAPDVPQVVQASALQTPIQPPNPAVSPPPDDMIKGVEPYSPPEPGKHVADDDTDDDTDDEPPDEPDRDPDQGRASDLGRRHGPDRPQDRGKGHDRKR
jgi:hypothetical protein